VVRILFWKTKKFESPNLDHPGIFDELKANSYVGRIKFRKKEKKNGRGRILNGRADRPSRPICVSSRGGRKQ
jgi:hypothetical protein